MQSQLANALGHPARILILSYLLHHRRACFKELNAIIILASPTVSQHLRILRDHNLIIAEQVGTEVFYELNRARCRDMFRLLTKLVKDFLDSCQAD